MFENIDIYERYTSLQWRHTRVEMSEICCQLQFQNLLLQKYTVICSTNMPLKPMRFFFAPLMHGLSLHCKYFIFCCNSWLAHVHCPTDNLRLILPDSKVLGTNMGPAWVLLAPGGPHVGLMNLAIRAGTVNMRLVTLITSHQSFHHSSHENTQYTRTIHNGMHKVTQIHVTSNEIKRNIVIYA